MALFACKVGGSEGTGALVKDKLTAISTSGQNITYSVASYPNFHDFTVDNFMYALTTCATTGSIIDQANNRSLSANFGVPTLTYDSSTGILTFKTNKATKSLDSGKISLGLNVAYDVYLIYAG